MYGNEFIRVRKIEKLLERLAYASIIIDAFVAIATIIFINSGVGLSSTILLLSDVIVFVEVTFAIILFALLVFLRHNRVLMKRAELLVFRTRRRFSFESLSKILEDSFGL